MSSFINYVFDSNLERHSDNYGSYYIVFGLPFYYFVRRSLDSNRISHIISQKITMASTAEEIRDYLDLFSIKLQEMKNKDMIEFKQPFLSFYNRSNSIGESAARRQAEIDHVQAKFGESRKGPHTEYSEVLLLGGGGEQDFDIWMKFYFQVIGRLRRLNRKATHAIFL